MVSNRRRFRRIALRTVLTTTGIITSQGESIRKSYQLQLEDLSAGGLRYRSRFPIPVGTRLDLVFQLADRKVRATVEVVRSLKTENGGYNVGCQFVSINPVAQEDIIRFVTLSSVRDAQPSSFYSQAEKAEQSANEPMGCGNCRCADCGDRETCRACYKPRCGRRFCSMYVPNRQDLRRKST
ncbi:MAG TPA: PilZ domain-containing protein [Selenomonadales bacterium]|nr:PilZ domain-containing protein [Selenomonadales bacterium]